MNSTPYTQPQPVSGCPTCGTSGGAMSCPVHGPGRQTPIVPMPSLQQRCPVCEGRGIVPHGFYMHPAGQPFTSSGIGPEQCKRCGGLGTIPVVGAGSKA